MHCCFQIRLNLLRRKKSYLSDKNSSTLEKQLQTCEKQLNYTEVFVMHVFQIYAEHG